METTEYAEYTEMQGLPPPLHPVKAQGALPQLFRKGKGFAGFSTSRTILHAARNGHISISRQRALKAPVGIGKLELETFSHWHIFKPCKCALARRAQEIGTSRTQQGVKINS